MTSVRLLSADPILTSGDLSIFNRLYINMVSLNLYFYRSQLPLNNRIYSLYVIRHHNVCMVFNYIVILPLTINQ